MKSAVPIFGGILVLSVIMYLSRTYIGTDGTALVSFFYLFIRISQAASEGNVAISNLKINWPSFKTLYAWNVDSVQMSKLQTEDIPEAKILLDSSILRLVMKEVDFGYGDGPAIFKDKNLVFKTGDLLLIKGQSGTGKSTLLALLLGVKEPKKGTVEINDINIQLVKQTLAKIVGYVGAEPFLIPGTVRENLSYGLSRAVSDEEVMAALQDACVLDSVLELPAGLDEPLNEMTQLSTGQKQRLAIARAYLKKPKILIWDEATANLDEALEKVCLENLLKKQKQLAIVVVSHKNTFDDKSTIRLNL